MTSGDYAAWFAAFFTAIMAIVTVLALWRDSSERRTLAISRRRDICATVVVEGPMVELRISNQSGQVIRNWIVDISGIGQFDHTNQGSLPPGEKAIRLPKTGSIEHFTFDVNYWGRRTPFGSQRTLLTERVKESKSSGYMPEVFPLATDGTSTGNLRSL
jgi:hypothetical protein